MTPLNFIHLKEVMQNHFHSITKNYGTGKHVLARNVKDLLVLCLSTYETVVYPYLQ